MRKLIFLSVVVFPFVTYGANIWTLTTSLSRVLGRVVPIIIGFALVVFLWGILKYIWSGSDEKQRIESRQFMLWGIIGLAVMVSVWALVGIIARLSGTGIPTGIVPQLPPRQ